MNPKKLSGILPVNKMAKKDRIQRTSWTMPSAYRTISWGIASNQWTRGRHRAILSGASRSICSGKPAAGYAGVVVTEKGYPQPLSKRGIVAPSGRDRRRPCSERALERPDFVPEQGFTRRSHGCATMPGVTLFDPVPLFGDEPEERPAAWDMVDPAEPIDPPPHAQSIRPSVHPARDRGAGEHPTPQDVRGEMGGREDRGLPPGPSEPRSAAQDDRLARRTPHDPPPVAVGARRRRTARRAPSR